MDLRIAEEPSRYRGLSAEDLVHPEWLEIAEGPAERGD